MGQWNRLRSLLDPSSSPTPCLFLSYGSCTPYTFFRSQVPLPDPSSQITGNYGREDIRDNIFPTFHRILCRDGSSSFLDQPFYSGCISFQFLPSSLKRPDKQCTRFTHHRSLPSTSATKKKIASKKKIEKLIPFKVYICFGLSHHLLSGTWVGGPKSCDV